MQTAHHLPLTNRASFVLTEAISSCCEEDTGPGCKWGGWEWLFLVFAGKAWPGDPGASASGFSRRQTWASEEQRQRGLAAVWGLCCATHSSAAPTPCCVQVILFINKSEIQAALI